MKKNLFSITVAVLIYAMAVTGCNNIRSTAGNDGESELTSPMSGKVLYVNSRYGFSFRLPDSWQGFSVVEDSWRGSKDGTRTAETGPVFLIRHPLWSSKKPRQDIPVMVFTLKQWNLVTDEIIRISAAPVEPYELGRNNRFVFALPPRYNYAYSEGFEEVEKIIHSGPISIEHVR